MKVAIISGSVRIGRQSHKLAVYFEKQLAMREGITPTILDLKEYNFPVMEERLGRLDTPPEGLEEFAQHIDEADAVVFVSPEYNGSYSGALKNATDYIYKQFSKKPIGVATASGGQMGGISASHMLQNLVLNLGGFPIPRKVLLPAVQNAFSESGELGNERQAQGIEAFLDDLLWLTEAVKNQKNK